MKKLLHYLSILTLVLLSGIAFTACGSDEPEIDPATTISGTYVGNGYLEIRGYTGQQKYPGMKMYVRKSSNEYVLLSPVEADGTSFFEKNEMVFQITKTASGDYVLQSSEYPEASVRITKAGHMDYEFPSVRIGSDTGTLKFSGEKQ